MDNAVRVLSTLALQGAVRSLAGRYQAQTGVRIDADFAPTLALLERLRAGEGADVVILTQEGLAGLASRRNRGCRRLLDCALLCRHRGESGAAHPELRRIPPCARPCSVPVPWLIRGSAPAAFSLPD